MSVLKWCTELSLLRDLFQVACFQMMTEVGWVEWLAGSLRDQRLGTEATAMLPDSRVQPAKQRLQITLANLFIQRWVIGIGSLE